VTQKEAEITILMRYRRGSGCTRDGKPVAPDEEKLSRSRVNADRTEIRTNFGGSGCAVTFDIRWFPNDLEPHHHIASLPLPYSPCPRPRISYRLLEKFHTSNPFQYCPARTRLLGYSALLTCHHVSCVLIAYILLHGWFMLVRN